MDVKYKLCNMYDWSWVPFHSELDGKHVVTAIYYDFMGTECVKVVYDDGRIVDYHPEGGYLSDSIDREVTLTVNGKWVCEDELLLKRFRDKEDMVQRINMDVLSDEIEQSLDTLSWMSQEEGFVNSRELSIVKTKLDEAQMWMRRAKFVYLGMVEQAKEVGEADDVPIGGDEDGD